MQLNFIAITLGLPLTAFGFDTGCKTFGPASARLCPNPKLSVVCPPSVILGPEGACCPDKKCGAGFTKKRFAQMRGSPDTGSRPVTKDLDRI
ncbi:hypothetical protein M0657_009377 [Pyricularia oryzae]|uniref:Uncharacterized protein n=2 Tax=Pyricularia oryzae TaxID=318829 RepID=A0AA97NLL5_PYRO3|nr:hypothetical protein OOU_Y34scaffold01166g1 [Pyricularia oryzae Y34]KAI7914631.1 hypothetical protein M0657_009377 [Pyricularia oryzae]